ncbi:MAG: TetR/AcrR family transcriptional regulator [Lachnospiraceae bacterium]|nr:TetR/AcrR family transcriptional regulator [Lachnospiraceae bacterium]
MSLRDTSIDPKLIESARREFASKGFLQAELKNICDNAGVTTGAVYKRYRGKEELFCALVKDTAETLDSFITSRAAADLSSMTDEEVRNSWIMNEKHLLDMFGLLWNYKEDFVLLLNRSAGTVYENYGHDFALRMTDAYMHYYKEAQRRGLADSDISEEEMHVLCTSFWTSVYEPFVHEMSWAEIEVHCKVTARFFDFAGAIGLKQ